MKRCWTNPRHWVLVATVVAVVPVGAQEKTRQAGKSAKPEPVFSGPQVGEELPGFRVQRVFGKDPDERFDPIATAAGKPVVVVFVHKLTRPGIAATRALAKFLGQRKKSGVGGRCGFFDRGSDTDDCLDEKSPVNWRRYLPSDLPWQRRLGRSVVGSSRRDVSRPTGPLPRRRA